MYENTRGSSRGLALLGAGLAIVLGAGSPAAGAASLHDVEPSALESRVTHWRTGADEAGLVSQICAIGQTIAVGGGDQDSSLTARKVTFSRQRLLPLLSPPSTPR